MTEDGERRIHERLDDLSQQVASIDKHTAEIAAACKPCKARVDTIDKQINGNGSDGIRAEVIGLTNKLTELREDGKSTIRWQRAQLGAFITALLGFLGMAAKHFFG